MVVARAVACLAEEGDTQPTVFAHHGAVEVRRVLKRVQAAQSARLVREGGRVACRFAGDDVDRARDGRRSEQRRSAATHHLDALDHVGRDLLQPVDARQRAEDGSRVDQDLRIGAVEAVDTHLAEAAVLAVGLHAHAGLELQSLGDVGRLGALEELRVKHVHERRCFAAHRLAACG